MVMRFCPGAISVRVLAPKRREHLPVRCVRIDGGFVVVVAKAHRGDFAQNSETIGAQPRIGRYQVMDLSVDGWRTCHVVGDRPRMNPMLRMDSEVFT